MLHNNNYEHFLRTQKCNVATMQSQWVLWCISLHDLWLSWMKTSQTNLKLKSLAVKPVLWYGWVLQLRGRHYWDEGASLLFVMTTLLETNDCVTYGLQSHLNYVYRVFSACKSPGDYWRLLEITGDYWRLLETTATYQRVYWVNSLVWEHTLHCTLTWWWVVLHCSQHECSQCIQMSSHRENSSEANSLTLPLVMSSTLSPTLTSFKPASLYIPTAEW